MSEPTPSQWLPSALVPGSGWIGIAALAENRVIGNNGTIPWHLPGDFAWFKRVTYGQILLMGRKTFESIGRPLPGRRTIVVSQTGFKAPGVDVVGSLDSVNALLSQDPRRVFLCGGAALYSQWLHCCSDLLLTHVHQRVTGEALFPEFEELFEPLAPVFTQEQFHVVHYVRCH